MSRFRSYATALVKRVVWNWKHRNKRMNPSKCPKDVLEYLHTLGPDAAVLDLGCSVGNLRAALRLRGWRGRFIGVDISEEAIHTARTSGDANSEWHVGTIEDFPIPDPKVAVICLCESLYYVRPGSVGVLLERCKESLISPGGRVVMRIGHPERHREYIALLLDLGVEADPPIYVLSGQARSS